MVKKTENIPKIVNEGVKSELFNNKLLTTINAQLFKINTGPDTEALNRVLKLVEKNIGFEKGMLELKDKEIGNIIEPYTK